MKKHLIAAVMSSAMLAPMFVANTASAADYVIARFNLSNMIVIYFV